MIAFPFPCNRFSCALHGPNLGIMLSTCQEGMPVACFVFSLPCLGSFLRLG